MALELKQQLKLSQQLVMTPQLQQAIKLLQLSNLELVTEVQQQLDENPLLEQVLDDETGPDGEQDTGDGEADASAEGGADADAGGDEGGKSAAEADAKAETAADEPAPVDEPPEPGDAPTAEPSAEEMVGDVDWDNYMESRPQTSMVQPPEDRPALEENLARAASLADHLQWQLGFLDLSQEEERVGAELIGNLTDDGYLEEDLEAIALSAGVDIGVAEKMLYRLQELDPVGVAARSLAECLEVQARRAGVTHALVHRVIQRHLDLLQRKDYRGIAALEDTTVEEVSRAADVIAGFEPRPGRQFSSNEWIYITPDIFVEKVADEYHVVLNDDDVPNLRVSATYRDVLRRNSGAAKETRDYVREKLRGALWMIRSIEQRKRTIVKVMHSILRFQREFFDKGSEHLRPLNLRDVAEDIGMHESTVSRVTTNKYVQTPHGVFELKFFFNSSIQTTDGDAIASESVKEKIRAIITNEDSRKPLSDQRIAELLKAAGISIARRTVTKYRESMRILSSTRRRQFR